jgi:phenylalanyl-tRNA synthetase beta chain
MGGANTEVTGGTARVLLESAWFAPASIRRTSRALTLRTDAAYRFERGADIEGLVTASARAAALIAEIAGGTIARGLVDAYPRKRKPQHVRLRMSRIKRVLGIVPPPAQTKKILAGLGLPVKSRGADLEVTVPSFRRDLAMEDDLVEEIIRVWGYDRIPSTLPGGAISLVTHPIALRQGQAVRRALVGAGLAEVVTYAFTDPAKAELLRHPVDPKPVELMNPLAQDASLLRVNPLEGVLSAVATNVRRQQPDVRVFEMSKTYAQSESEPASASLRPPSVKAGLTVPATKEPRWVAVALTGARAAGGWAGAAEPADVYDAKGLAEHTLDTLGVRASTGNAGALAGFELDCHGTLVAESGAIVAEFGEVAAALRESFGIPTPVFAAVVSLDAVGAAAATPLRYQALPRFPAVERDLAFVIGSDQTLTAAQIESSLREEAGPLLRRLVLFDVFRFPDGRSSLAWRLLFQAEDRTLTDAEVNAIQERVVRRITETFHITLRSG